MRDEEYFAIKRRAVAVLRTIPDVTAVGMGGRERNGRPTGEIVIKVFVRRKKPAADVPAQHMIPASFEGVPTDVVAMGPPVPCVDPVPGVAHSQLQDTEQTLTHPLQGGMLIAMEPTSTATFGCLLRDKVDGTAVYGLTNCHVVSNDETKLSQSRRIMRPDGSGTFDSDPVGYVFAGREDSSVDAAVIRLEAGREWLPAIKEIGFVQGTYEVTLADSVTQLYQVRKRGARTRLTGGIIHAVDVETVGLKTRQKKFDFIVRPNAADPPHEAELSHFGARGDSGSVVVNVDNEVIGLFWGSEDPATRGMLDFLAAYVTPIAFVLDFFRKAHELDLDVATPIGPNPTNASELQTVLPPAGAPLLPVSDLIAKRDHGHRRPLVGGAQVMAEPFGAANSATLGCIVTQKTDPGTAYILTSYAGLSAGGLRPPTTDTDVGQPDNSDSCSLCCKNTVGEFAKGGPDDATPTAAIVTLKGDQQWLAEVLQIGFLGGTATVTAGEVTSGRHQVRKRGAGSRLTGGVVTAIGGVAGALPPGVRPDAMIIRPNPNPLKPGQALCFSNSIDRGAVVVDGSNRVVGLLYDEVEILEAGVKVVHGVATPIQTVIDGLNLLPGIDVEVAIATVPDKVRTTANRVAADREAFVPASLTGGASQRDPTQESTANGPALSGALDRLRAELSRSTSGRCVIALWSDHRGEIRHLIDHNRKVATVWHRSGGPALLQAFVRALEMPSATIPARVNGVPTAACLDRLVAAFRRYGSPALQADVTQLRALLPSIGGHSLSEILDAFGVAGDRAARVH